MLGQRGIQPENLPAAENIKKVERRVASNEKKIEKTTQKYINHIITELKPVLAEIIRQGIKAGQICFSDPDALAEIVLIVLTVKMDNTLVPSSKEDIENTISALVSLLEKGTDNPPGSLNFLIS